MKAQSTIPKEEVVNHVRKSTNHSPMMKRIAEQRLK